MRRKTGLLLTVLLAALMIVTACGGGGGGGSNPATTTYSISGTVTASSVGLQGIAMTLSGASSASATTDASGNYSFTGLANGNYMITPSKTGYSFTPTSSAQTVNGANITGINFTATANTASGISIASNAVSDAAAFDGTNYLVGIEYNINGTAKQIDTYVGAQMMASDGTKIGSVIETSQHGMAASIAFDGTNYLMVWEDNGGISPTNCNFSLYGQFISKAGNAVGTSFVISSGIEFDGVNILTFGGGKYLVAYTKLINTAQCENSTNRYIAGRIISPDNTMGSEFRISAGNGAGNSMAFDGTNFFVVWREDSQDTEVRGRFVSSSGVLGTEISINASAAPSDNPLAVAFDGTNYMVVWNDEVDVVTGNWDVFGQLLKTDGTLVGSVITITNEPGEQMAASIAFDGTDYLVVWIDMNNDANHDTICNANEGTCWDVYGQYIGKDGTLVGNKITINSDATNQMGFVTGYNNGKYLVLVDSGVVLGSGGPTQAGDLLGVFITPNVSPSLIGTWFHATTASSSNQTLTITATTWENNDAGNNGCIERGTYTNNSTSITSTYDSKGGCHGEAANSTVVLNYTVDATTLKFYDTANGSLIDDYVRQ